MTLALTALKGIPIIKPGDNLAGIILSSIQQSDLTLEDGDILVLAQKIVSKAENQFINLAKVLIH